MLSTLQGRYARLERALDALTESIASYNPSSAAADELVAADNEVKNGLEQLVAHHNRYGRILALRQASEALDGQIRSTVTLLSDTRKQLLAVPGHATSQPDAREVRVDDILSYAKFISKTTVPPTLQGEDGSRAELSSKVIESSIAVRDGAKADTADVEMAMEIKGTNLQQMAGQSEQVKTEEDKTAAVSTMSQEAKQLLDPVSRLPFVPWPTQEIINAGALGAIQSMLERGQDPTTVTSREANEAQALVDAEARAKASAQREADEEEEHAQRRRLSLMHVGGHERHAPEEDVFDPDEM